MASIDDRQAAGVGLVFSARCLLGLLVFLLCGPAVARAQQDSVTVVASDHYRAGSLQRLLLGRSYRELWAMPVWVQVLDPATFAGGVTPVRVGGGGSTKSLRMHGNDGRTYVFRSVDKDAFQTLGPEWRGTLAAALIQDQVSAKHPGAALVVPPLLDAAGVLHVTPELFVMPDHPLLGDFREEFAGRLGTVEERPEEADDEDRPGFADATRVVSTERLLRYLDAGSHHQVDSRAFLAARLIDVLVGDWDRHADQWRWARFERPDGTRLWSPIPRDRDNAFVSNDGLVLSILRTGFPRLVDFHARSPNVYGLTMNAAPLDRRFLSELSAAVWDSVTSALQARLTDAVIDAGIARLPAEYRAHSGDALGAGLRSRRDHLHGTARRFYVQLASEVDVHATNQADVVEIDRRPDGSVDVRLYAPPARALDSSTLPYFRRTFWPQETNEVRVHLQDGDDHAMVGGEAKRSIRVRVIGGTGDDVLVDSSRVRSRSGRTVFHDDQGENTFVVGRRTSVDRRVHDAPIAKTGALPAAHAPRDWGSLWAPFSPSIEWKSNAGLVLGGGPSATHYGFRHDPYARRMMLRALVAPNLGGFGIEYAADFRRASSGRRLEVHARASDLDVTRFHGLGNQTVREGDDAQYRIEERRFGIELALHTEDDAGIALFAGPALRYTDPRTKAEAPGDPEGVRGTDAFGQVGGHVGAVLDWRDSPTLPRHGMLLRITGSGYPIVWGDVAPFATTMLAGSAYLTPPAPVAPTLALRAGVQRSWGDFPIQEAAALGGAGTLRGHPNQRYSGVAALFGGAELRARLAPVNVGVRGDLGVFGLADAGRVYVANDSPGGWHTAIGGGLWFAVLDAAQVISVSYARGEEHRLYVRTGFGF